MNADRINELYAGEIFSPEVQSTARERIHWICRQARGERILDIGCSQGIVCLLLGREGFNCIGIDCEEFAIDYALEELEKEENAVRKKVEFKIGEAAHLPFEDDSFDTVILGEIIEHLNHPEKVLKEANRVLRQDGMAIITVPFGLNPDPDHKRTYYPVSFLSRVQPFFKTDIIDTIDNYIIYCGIKDLSYSISKVSKEALLLESLRLQNKTEERFLLKEQELFAKSKQFNEKVNLMRKSRR
jgi:2-polyprenyl-6-hydroxyphenyl methylase/3-demethylubiquinone-9 3-methyltransferase